MALRKTILANGETYHIFNRSVQGVRIFRGRREGEIFVEAMRFYLQPRPPTKFSKYRLSRDRYPIKVDEPLVTIINFCLMPNHFHFTLRQEKEEGIRKFIQRLLNSFAHYFSVKYKNRGPVFEGNFKAVRVENDEQLVHLSRYIHLNPVTACLVNKPEEYWHSSYRAYLDKEDLDFVDPTLVLDQFSSRRRYREFVLSQRDYQMSLDKIKHLMME
jgi:putative transposase